MSGLTDQVNQSQVIASPGRSISATNNEVLHNDQLADRVASSQSDDETRNKLCQDAAGESRPQSCLSTSTSSGSAQTNRASSGTHTMCKFKDKRPEPLKLSANLNQEIPLDLSVKSAGNVPSGTLGNIFNLQTNQMMATLETPRIVWQDNEALLIKPRLFSSSTSASQRIKLSSLAGDSPPITPNTPFSDMICSPPTSAGAIRQPHSGQPRSAGLLSYESTTSVIQALMSAQLQYNQHQAQMIEDSWAGKLMLNNNSNNNKRLNAIKSPSNNNNGGSGGRDKHPPRRSCSTESLSGENNSKANFLLTAQRHQRHQQQVRINQDRFSYAGQPISSNTGSNSKRNNEANNNGKDEISTQTGKSLTPTSLASATTNLLNINLNSPTNRVPPKNQNDCSPSGAQISPSLSDLVLAASHQQQQQQLQKSPGSSEGRAQFHTAAPSDVDPLLSAAYCQQPSSGSFRSSLASAFSASSYSMSLANQPADGEAHLTPSENQLAAAYKAEASQQHQLLQQMSTTSSGSNPLGSFGGSTTLNTPTLISPSQLKNNNSLCFLPSPTLSPMSVFELPSPLLMFAPMPAAGASQPQQQQQQQSQPQPPTSQQRQPVNRQAGAVSPTTRLPFEMAPSFNRRFNSELAVSKELAQVEQSSQVVGRGAVCSNRVASCDTPLNSLKDNDKQPAQIGAAASELSLAHLVTAAHNKLGQSSALLDDDDDDCGGDGRNLVCMDVEGSQTVKPEVSATHVGANFPRIFVSQEQQQRRICESADIQWQNQSSKLYPPFCTPPATREPDGIVLTGEQQQQQQRMQRNAINKRALSPLSFRNRVSCYHNQRYESCSAPPDVNQCRARPKFKGLASSDSPQHQQQQQHLSGSIACPPHDHHTSKPYPEPQVAGRWPQPLAGGPPISSGGHLSTPFGRPLIGTRPSSAEPLTDGQLQARTHSGSYQAPGNHQQGLHHHLMGGGNFSQSTQHLHSNQFSLGTHLGGLGSSFSQQLGRHSNNNLALNQMGQQQQQQQHLQMQSVSAGELHQLPSLSSCGPTVMGGSSALCSVGARQQQQQQQRQPNQPLPPPPPPHPPPLLHTHQPHQRQHQQQPLHQQHNQQAASAAFAPSMTELDHLHMQRQRQQHSNEPTLPFQSVMAPQQLRASNQLVQGQSAAQASWPEDRPPQQQQQQQQQPRALSADGRDSSMSVPMRPESAFSGSGSELSCFRSSSTTSSGAHANAAPKKYRCDQCSKSFTRSDMLTRHKRLHSGDRPFQCSECKQEFSRSDHLSTHVRTHTGEKPYKCKLCSYSACRKDMIARHMKVHSRSSPNAQQPTPI